MSARVISFLTATVFRRGRGRTRNVCTIYGSSPSTLQVLFITVINIYFPAFKFTNSNFATECWIFVELYLLTQIKNEVTNTRIQSHKENWNVAIYKYNYRRIQMSESIWQRNDSEYEENVIYIFCIINTEFSLEEYCTWISFTVYIASLSDWKQTFAYKFSDSHKSFVIRIDVQVLQKKKYNSGIPTNSYHDNSWMINLFAYINLYSSYNCST